jgi:hypothetical protein
MRSITRLQRRLGLGSAIVLVSAGGFLLAGSGGPDQTVPEPAPTTSDPRGPVTDAGPNAWEANDLATVLEACSQPLAGC